MTVLTEQQKEKRRQATARWRLRRPKEYRESQRRSEEKRRGKRVPIPKEKIKEYRLKRLEQPGYRDRLNKEANARNKVIKTWIATYKIEKGCTDCGYNKHHAALDFDHVRGEKKFNVCFAKSVTQAKTEIEKCEVVCSNCHRIRTYERLKNL